VSTSIPKLFLGILIFALPALADEPLDHLIEPGYVPEEAADEQGLWMELADIERELNKSAMLVRDADLNNYVQRIVCRVADDYCEDFRVYMVRNPGFNASMTATGMMQIWTGLVVRASSTDEIAAVVGHEIAHYTRLHSLQRFRKIKSKMASATVFDLGLVVLTGVPAPLGQVTALLSLLSFNREQETEADLLGTRLLAEANYDPHASYEVWNRLLDEENAAAVKREKIGIFSKTHPNSRDRANYLNSYVVSNFGPADVEKVADQALLDILNKHYLFLMEDQLDTNRFGRTREILVRHTKIGVEPSLVNYFFGEMYRQRGDDGDQELAMAAYTKSIEGGKAPAEAYKNLGYLLLKAKENKRAQSRFRQYLDIRPEASDRAMIEFYLTEEQR